MRFVDIDETHAGQRLDNFLLGELKGVTRSLVYRIVRKGEVRVNKGRAKPTYRLVAGDRVRIPPLRLASPATGAKSVVPASMATALDTAVLYEDAELLVLDKPAGLAVHGGSGLRFGVIESLRELRPHTPFLELAHRLDRETSGVLVLAKSRGILVQLHALLREGGMHKEYLALLVGAWRGGSRTVDAPLARSARRGNERLVEVSEEQGAAAVSRFRPVRRWREHTLVAVDIGTGRTHQIRVHAASLGYPVVGDAKYGDFAANRGARDRGLKRQFLHAASLAFQVPDSGRKFRFEAPLPEDLQAYLDRLG
ncbi:RluA family pseudouridine synthase [Acidihalobacter ferrooxydans]|uniref:RluA family pseudouridine synthase n=1 Tax=Acidihalobacter ferrooxydans TaxID=1765967 RepID=UPI001E2D9B6F|nr:RluA family pseudouridine synthase [Acidihalobacter ferrooxydans]